MTDENARVPDCIYLQPDCCVDWGGEGRQWCEDDVWGDDCPDHSPAIEYTRKALAAQPRDDVRFKFGEAVWDALKADANDLRKQQRIVKAFDTALAPTTQGTDSGLAHDVERLVAANAELATENERLRTDRKAVLEEAVRVVSSCEFHEGLCDASVVIRELRALAKEPIQ